MARTAAGIGREQAVSLPCHRTAHAVRRAPHAEKTRRRGRDLESCACGSFACFFLIRSFPLSGGELRGPGAPQMGDAGYLPPLHSRFLRERVERTLLHHRGRQHPGEDMKATVSLQVVRCSGMVRSSRRKKPQVPRQERSVMRTAKAIALVRRKRRLKLASRLSKQYRERRRLADRCTEASVRVRF